MEKSVWQRGHNTRKSVNSAAQSTRQRTSTKSIVATSAEGKHKRKGKHTYAKIVAKNFLCMTGTLAGERTTQSIVLRIVIIWQVGTLQEELKKRRGPANNAENPLQLK